MPPARFQEPEAFKKVIEMTDRSKEPQLRLEAIAALGAFLDQSMLSRLVALLKDPDDSVRGAARKSIDQIRYYLEQEAFARAGR